MNMEKRTKITQDKKKKKKQNEPLAIKHMDYLTLLSKTKNVNTRKKLIDAGNRQQIKAVAECVKNIVTGNVPLSKSQLTRLKKHRTVLRNMMTSVRNATKQKALLKQKGGFLPMLLPIAIQALSGLFSGGALGSQ
jgi:formate dehydrogenase maturation protein FdhE